MRHNEHMLRKGNVISRRYIHVDTATVVHLRMIYDLTTYFKQFGLLQILDYMYV